LTDYLEIEKIIDYLSIADYIGQTDAFYLSTVYYIGFA